MTPPVEVVTAFQRAFDAHDIDQVMALMTEDCIFDDTAPPDGQRHQGHEAVRARWRQFFRDAPQAQFQTEEIFAAGDRVVVRWTYSWGDGHVRGVDLFRIRQGRVSEKLSYVKG